MSAELSRRSALKLLSANVALLAAGCGRPPEEVLPYVHMPERVVPGVPLQYASTLPLGGLGRGVLCSSYDGRPIKVSGNPLHPASLGSTDVFAEAHVLSLYDPDRSQVTRHKGQIVAAEALQGALADRLAGWRGGAAAALLTGPLASPTMLRQIAGLKRLYPGLRWHVHDPLADEAARQGSTIAFGRPLDRLPRWAEVDVVVALDADPLGPGPAQIVNARGFTDRRRVRAGGPAMARLYVCEPAPTLTGAKADHRWAMRPGEVAGVATALARGLGARLPEPVLAADTAASTAAMLADLRHSIGRALVLAGPGQPPAVHALVHWINDRLRAPVDFIEPIAPAGDGTLADLMPALEGGSLDLVITGCNPVYDAPGDLRVGDAMRRLAFCLHQGPYVDETAAASLWHMPESHPLEGWGDLRGPDGTASPVQPLIRSFYATRTLPFLLEMLAGRFDTTDYDTVRETWRDRLGDTEWRRALQDGVIPGTAAAAVQPGTPRLPEAIASGDEPAPVLRLAPDPSVFDGSFSNNAWLQECPKPLSKEVWGHSVGLHPGDAARHGVGTGDGVRLSVQGRSLEVVARIDPGLAPGVMALTLGYGRSHAGLIGSHLGANAFGLRSAGSMWTLSGVEATPAPAPSRLFSTQGQFAIDGDRDEIFPSHVAADLGHRGPEQPALPLPTLLPERHPKPSAAQWAMVIDSTACVGCNACVVACQVENNVPVVGPEEIDRNRGMHWLRIDAYDLEGPGHRTGFQPVPCMHCEQAPCEPVCPVGASIHDSEGLNVQVYNRCIGTRFCEANCPYKVRRFNFFGYADGQQYGNLGAVVMKGHNNPDVTVRARGVMEKCTFCVQRISGARRQAEKDGRPLREGDVTTACQDACPARAISFGDLAEKGSAVAALREEPQHFAMLGKLNTRPRTTYLADLRNPNPALGEG